MDFWQEPCVDRQATRITGTLKCGPLNPIDPHQLKREHRFVYNSRGSKGSNCLYRRRYTDDLRRHSPQQFNGLQPLQDPDVWPDAYGDRGECGTLTGC